MTYSIHTDGRYSIRQEFTGAAKPQWVVRFCGDFICSVSSKPLAVLRAIGHRNALLGNVITEQN